jgi:hypothetical protein
MADFVFNIAKGKVAQYIQNVEDGSPADSRLLLIPFDATGATEDQIVDADTVAAVEAVTNVTERTATGWNRKTLTASDITITVDDTNNRVDIDITDQTWTGVSAGAVTRLVLAYIPDGNVSGGVSADSACIPLTCHDFAITPDGSDVVAVINSAGIFRAS